MSNHPYNLGPLALKNFTLKNKLVVSPMCQYSAEDGFANDWHLVHLGKFAMGGMGAIIQEATAISPEGRISYADLGIWKDEHIEKYKQITAFIKSQGSLPGIQLAHAGRKASTDLPWKQVKQLAPTTENGWQTLSSSNIPYHPEDHPPLELSLADIQQHIDLFKQAAERAVAAGYEIIELHAAHGYLIHQFLSPLINKRTDAYGGSLENRTRFLLEIIDAVKPILEGKSLWVRISATDWAPGGWDLPSSIALSKILKDKGVEVIDVSTGGAVREQEIITRPCYQVPFATRIKEESGMLIGTVGLITSAQQIQYILQQGQADIVLIGRELLRNPHFAFQVAEEINIPVSWPNQYLRAK